MVLFCNYKTLSVAADDKGKKFKGQGGKRVMYTTHHPAWDAKNRFGLPDELDMNFSGIAHIFAPKQETQPATTEPNFDREAVDYSGIPQNLVDLMKANNVIPAEIMAATESKGYYPTGTPIQNYDPGYIDGVLVAAWPQVFTMIQEIRKQQQF